MNRCSFIISQRAQDFSQDDMGPQCSLGPIVGRLYTRIDDKCEPVVKSIIDFADEFLDFLYRVLFRDQVPERFSKLNFQRLSGLQAEDPFPELWSVARKAL